MYKILLSLCFIIPLCVYSSAATPGISAAYDAKKKAVYIRWQYKEPGIKTFIIQRSSDNNNWTDIALQATPGFTTAREFQYYDYKAVTGQNYYRLKCVTEKEKEEYSAAVMVITGGGAGNWVMYPVPVTDVLTLQYKGTEKIAGVVNVFIQNVTGRIITRLRSGSLNTTIRIPVDNLGKGVYDVRIVIEDEVVWNQRFVK
ncbi:T9SS type A sorting domain-containing protein [Ferruginibacter sp.]